MFRPFTWCLTILLLLAGGVAGHAQNVYRSASGADHGAGQPTVVSGADLASGVNHHLGDDSFVAKFGRLPNADDSEALRMHVHLQYVRDLLSKQPATSAALLSRRAQLLSYLDDYITLGVTPKNLHVAHRSPVFIDDDGAICAVGYLIERSVGRSLAEKIANDHRYQFLETIAQAMPEVAEWIAQSGFTVTELASIQPAYEESHVTDWRMWNPKKEKLPDGAYSEKNVHGSLGVVVNGQVRKRLMEGNWQVLFTGNTYVDHDDVAKPKPYVRIGEGTLKKGSGAWTSYDSEGHKLGEGWFVDNFADGEWQIFHANGSVAANGKLRRGVRVGAWTFYDDTAEHRVIASGWFDKWGNVSGSWKHFDRNGVLAATTSYNTPRLWGDFDPIDGGEGLVLTLAATAKGVVRVIHQGSIGSFDQAAYTGLESISFAGVRVFRHHLSKGATYEVLYDVDGNRLDKVGEQWNMSSCGWTQELKRSASRGDLAAMQGLLFRDAKRRLKAFAKLEEKNPEMDSEPAMQPQCAGVFPVPAATAKLLDTMLLLIEVDHPVAPMWIEAMMTKPLLARDWSGDEAEKLQAMQSASHLDEILVQGMDRWMQWPHIDDLFDRLFMTMPGRSACSWANAYRDKCSE
jgi:hypothetical protein